MERPQRTANVIDYNDHTSSEEDTIYEGSSSDESKSEESEVKDCVPRLYSLLTLGIGRNKRVS
jgi:hypothetical protein